ncbi:hypothetical protein BSKO_06213 [Bryopsis sp. KO-2023]|nr:hypothetical protein BSKO_06213 [Bryopsis sp. KO-2023]
MPYPPLNPGAEACLLRHEIKALQTRFNRLQSEFSSMGTLVDAFSQRVERFLRARPLPSPKKKKTPSRIRVWLSVLCCMPVPEGEDDDGTDWLLGTQEQRAAAPPSFASSASSQAAEVPFTSGGSFPPAAAPSDI